MIQGRTSASRLFLTGTSDPSALPTHLLEDARQRKARPLNTLLASAQRLTGEDVRGRGTLGKAESWQDDAWEMFDLVGEQRFLVTTLAGRISQAQLYVGKINPDAPVDTPEPVLDQDIASIIDVVGGTHSGQTQMVKRLAINLFVAGDGWLAGIPRWLVPGTMEYRQAQAARASGLETTPDTPAIDDLEWVMLSVSEVGRTSAGMVEIRLSPTKEGKIEVDPDDVYLIRVWNPHPRKSWEADSPTRASLGVLRELVGLTMDISAQVDSRLAGAGLLIVPQSAQRALAAAASAGGVEEDTEDLFTEALMEAMLTPIQDRGSASALVPLVVTVPDESAQHFRHISFGRDLNSTGGALREESIRRLALGQDAPPELLLGTAGMNHWGAWLVREDVVTTHLEPPLAMICDALTTQYLWPVLEENFGMTPEEYREYVIWYDVSDLMTRPNRAADAKELHERGIISDSALRRETGFEESDAPDGPKDQPIEVMMALSLIERHPSLMASPGLYQMAQHIGAVLRGEEPEERLVLDEEAEAAEEGAPGGKEPPANPSTPPDTSDAPAPEPAGMAYADT